MIRQACLEYISGKTKFKTYKTHSHVCRRCVVEVKFFAENSIIFFFWTLTEENWRKSSSGQKVATSYIRSTVKVWVNTFVNIQFLVKFLNIFVGIVNFKIHSHVFSGSVVYLRQILVKFLNRKLSGLNRICRYFKIHSHVWSRSYVFWDKLE